MLEKGTKVRVAYRSTVTGVDGSQMDFWAYVEKAIEGEGYILAAPFRKIDAARYTYTPDDPTLITVAAEEVVAY